jgi:hypothetical protein
LTFDLPADVALPGLDDVHLCFAEVTKLSLPDSGQHPSDVTVLSAGEEVGDFGHIFVNGRDVSPNQRGYNIALIQPNDQGQTDLQTANFDTFCDLSLDPNCVPNASAELANFISTASAQTLVAVAAADEASYNLKENAVLALARIGATGDLRGCFRCSHALIHDPIRGITLEALDPLRPAGVTTDLGLTEPNIAALVDWIRVDPVAE